MFERALSAVFLIAAMSWSAFGQEAPKASMLPPVESRPAQIALPTKQPSAYLPNDEFCRNCLPCCDPCGPEGRLWVRGEFLLTWMRGARSPALVTSSPSGTSQAQAGVVTATGTQILYGDERINTGVASGFQLRVGGWFDRCQTIGLEGGLLYRGGQSQNEIFGSDSGGIVSRPYFNAATGQADAQLVSFPGVLDGSVSVNADLGRLLGLDLSARIRLCCFGDRDPCQDGNARTPNSYSRLDLLVGYRHYDFSDRIRIDENLTPTSGLFVDGTNIRVQDYFAADNRFDGASLALDYEWSQRKWFVNGLVRVSVGNSSRRVQIDGHTTTSVPGDTTITQVGGLLAQTSNIGSYGQSPIVVIPELELKVGYWITPRFRVFGGYNVMIWPQVARAAEQIDPNVNENLIPGSTGAVTGTLRPSYNDVTSTLWVQGFTFGAEFRW